MEFVSKELAIKLKEKGFDKPCFGWYYINTPTGMTDGELVLNRYPCRGGTYEETLERHIDFQPKEGFVGYINKMIVDAPTIEQVLKWLREKDIIVYCKPYHTMATKNHIMYEWNVDVFSVDTKETKEDNKNVCLTYVDNDFGYVRYSSFDCIANYDDAILAGINFIVEHLI